MYLALRTQDFSAIEEVKSHPNPAVRMVLADAMQAVNESLRKKRGG